MGMGSVLVAGEIVQDRAVRPPVTGAGSGIGRAAALALHCAGYNVAVAGRRLGELERTASMVDGGGRMIPVQADVSKPDSVTAL